MTGTAPLSSSTSPTVSVGFARRSSLATIGVVQTRATVYVAARCRTKPLALRRALSAADQTSVVTPVTIAMLMKKRVAVMMSGAVRP